MDTLQTGWARLSDAAVGVASSVGNTVSDKSGQLGTHLQDLAGAVATRTGFASRPPPTPAPTPMWSAALNRILQHKRVAIALGLSGAACGAYWLVNHTPNYSQNSAQQQRRKKRLARRAPDGGRVEVVVLVGSPQEPLSRVLASDLNIRGFIVYMTATTADEEEWVRREKSGDIRCLRIANPDSAEAIQAGLQHLITLLETPVASFAGGTPRFLSLAGVIIVPDLTYPTGPLEATSLSVWHQTIHAKLEVPVNLLTAGLLDVVRQHASRLILVTPAIIGSLNPAFHVAESICVAALSALALSLSRELAGQRIAFTHMKLGSFDTHHINMGSGSSSPAVTEHQMIKTMRADILGWPERVRRLYAAPYAASAYLQTNRTRGSKLRVLHHAIYDVLVSSNPPRVIHVGRGSYAYQALTAVLPERVMSLILSTASS